MVAGRRSCSAGCGTATSARVADDPGETPSSHGLDSSTDHIDDRLPSPPPTSRPLDDFPLARGYPATNGDDGSPVGVTDESGVEDLAFCGRSGMERRRVRRTWSARRTPARPRTSAAARWPGTTGRTPTMWSTGCGTPIEACPEEEVGGTTQVYELLPGDSGDDSFFVTHRYRSDYGFDTGLEVIGVIRLDDLVLLTFEYGEGGGSADSIRRSLREVVDQSSALMPELCEYARQPCSEREPSLVVPIGPDGIEDLTLGMSAADAAAAGLIDRAASRRERLRRRLPRRPEPRLRPDGRHPAGRRRGDAVGHGVQPDARGGRHRVDGRRDRRGVPGRDRRRARVDDTGARPPRPGVLVRARPRPPGHAA